MEFSSGVLLRLIKLGSLKRIKCQKLRQAEAEAGVSLDLEAKARIFLIRQKYRN